MTNGTGNLPVTLLAAGWRCLVVGGGPVALRKVVTLLEAGTQVRVVSPDVCSGLMKLIDEGRADYVKRAFDPADVDGYRIVFAATDKRDVNGTVRDAARSAGSLCCCVDSNWSDGDFVSPAALHSDGLTVAVSTGGRSYRQARLVKESLARHIETLKTADLMVIGTSHRLLHTDKREPFHLAGEARDAVARMIMQVWGVHEFMILNTCNRVEVVAVVSAETGGNGVLERLLGFDRLDDDEFYRLKGMAAFEHLALVTAGMLSQSPGEHHVSSQVKTALEWGLEQGCAGGMISEWVSLALHISKEIKRVVEPLLEATEIESQALEHLPGGPGKAIVVGTGVVGQGLVEGCLARGYDCVWCYHRNRPKPDEEWAGRVEVVGWDELRGRLAETDAVLCAADAPGGVLRAEDASSFTSGRAVTLIDLGMPRNIDPDLVAALPDAALVDLEVLESDGGKTGKRLKEALAESRRIVKEHQKQYESLLQSFQGGNTA